MGLNVVGIISLNLAIALSGRHLENEFFISGIYSDKEKSKVIKKFANYLQSPRHLQDTTSTASG